MKLNIPFESITLSWGFVPKENSYGIKNLIIEGGDIVNGFLVDGVMEEPITAYFSPVVKKK